MKPHEMRAEAAKKLAEAKTIFDGLKATGADPSAEQEARHDALVTEAEGLLNKAKEIEARENRLNALEKQMGTNPGRQGDPLPHQDERNTRNGYHGYSLIKLLRQMDPGARRDSLDGLELETHQELAKGAVEGGHKLRGAYIPWDLPVDTRASGLYAQANGLERRNLTTTTGVGAVINATMPTMIELLRVQTLLYRLGARVMAGMQGNFALPRQSGAATGYWINPETGTITQSNQTIDNVLFGPKTLGAQTVYSRSFLHQTAVDAEMFVREDITKVIAIALDNAGFAGSGSGSTPTGILNDSTVSVISSGANGGAPTWELLALTEQAVSIANALNGSLAVVTSSQGRYALKTTVKDSNTAAKYLWNEDTNQVNGYPGFATNQLPSNLTKGSGTALTALLFGDFAQAIFAFWGGLDTIVNPYTNSASGAVEITLLQDADFHLRHGGSFAVIKDMIAA